MPWPRFGSLPGVESAAAGNSLPVIGGPRGGTGIHILGTPEVPMNDRPNVVVRVVTPGYFRTLRIPVLRGREFTDADDSNPTPGFVVNDAFAKANLAGSDPLRASISVWMQDENPYLADHRRRRRRQRRLRQGRREADGVLQPSPDAGDRDDAVRAGEAAGGARRFRRQRDPRTRSQPGDHQGSARSRARSPRASRASGSARWSPAHLRSAGCCSRRSGSTACSHSSSPSARKRSASASRSARR